MHKKKSSFSLLEMLVAISLLSILLSSLFFWYKKISFEQKGSSVLLKPILQERYADIKLGRIIPKIKKEQETLFYTDETQLVFIFDHGPNPEPLLSDAIWGRIYHDSRKQTLCLDIRPHPLSNKESPMQTHILLTDVQSLSFSFYHPPSDPKKIVDPETVGDNLPQLAWQPIWKKGYQKLPGIVKIIVERPLFFAQREPLEFTYVIEEQTQEINFYR